MSHACMFDSRMNCPHRVCQPGSRLDTFYTGDPNDSEVGRFPARRLVVTDEGVEFEPSALVFNEEETAIDEHIVAALHGIHDLGLKVNHQELAHAVHTMQLFVIKHMLQRLGSPEFSDWYEKPLRPLSGWGQVGQHE